MVFFLLSNLVYLKSRKLKKKCFFFLFGHNNKFEQLIKNNVIHLVLFQNTPFATKIISSQSLSANIKRFKGRMRLNKFWKPANLQIKVQDGSRHHSNHEKQQTLIDYLVMLTCLVNIILEFIEKKNSPINQLRPFLSLKIYQDFTLITPNSTLVYCF